MANLCADRYYAQRVLLDGAVTVPRQTSVSIIHTTCCSAIIRCTAAIPASSSPARLSPSRMLASMSKSVLVKPASTAEFQSDPSRRWYVAAGKIWLMCDPICSRVAAGTASKIAWRFKYATCQLSHTNKAHQDQRGYRQRHVHGGLHTVCAQCNRSYA